MEKEIIIVKDTVSFWRDFFNHKPESLFGIDKYHYVFIDEPDITPNTYHKKTFMSPEEVVTIKRNLYKESFFFYNNGIECKKVIQSLVLVPDKFTATDSDIMIFTKKPEIPRHIQTSEMYQGLKVYVVTPRYRSQIKFPEYIIITAEKVYIDKSVNIGIL